MVSHYEMTVAGCKVLYLPMEFAKSDFTSQQQEIIKSLQNAIVICVDLVYSDYPAGTDFSSLTQRRLETLQKLLPGVFTMRNMRFRKYRQTTAKTKNAATDLDHGFFIYFRPLPSATSSKKEISEMKNMLKETSTEKNYRRGDTSNKWNWQLTILADTSYGVLTSIKIPEGTTRQVLRISVKDAVLRQYIPKNREQDYFNLDSVYQVIDRKVDLVPDGSYSVYHPIDSTVFKVLGRHKWNNAFIISDVTGSMYPYTGQLLKWLKLNLANKGEEHFLFFNDGDNKPDNQKIIGKTGGLYPVFTSNYEEVEAAILDAMEHGSGGDAAENNMEALIAANRICKNCDTIVMIADNWAPVKDISLLSSFRKPVKIILCGVFDKIHPDYLKLARDTKGSIHLIEEDIYNLAGLKEGATIKIHGRMYQLIQGDFYDVTPRE